MFTISLSSLAPIRVQFVLTIESVHIPLVALKIALHQQFVQTKIVSFDSAYDDVTIHCKKQYKIQNSFFSCGI